MPFQFEHEFATKRNLRSVSRRVPEPDVNLNRINIRSKDYLQILDERVSRVVTTLREVKSDLVEVKSDLGEVKVQLREITEILQTLCRNNAEDESRDHDGEDEQHDDDGEDERSDHDRVDEEHVKRNPIDPISDPNLSSTTPVNPISNPNISSSTHNDPIFNPSLSSTIAIVPITTTNTTLTTTYARSILYG
ncbi:uncharacterized protein LOC120088836 [Benincasa hispida]|uniref:uncharacterized protein LOC120088836 n=1 Tax=Benincasa hispida TaxID=102211 RepID=UPI0018FFF079|nr:uncharacterized protein LOC120088836 [Benincasa hispida]